MMIGVEEVGTNGTAIVPLGIPPADIIVKAEAAVALDSMIALALQAAE